MRYITNVICHCLLGFSFVAERNNLEAIHPLIQIVAHKATMWRLYGTVPSASNCVLA